MCFPPGGCLRLTLAGLTAGTEVYDPVLDNDVEGLIQISSRGGAPGSLNPDAASFAFADPRPSNVCIPSMPFRSTDTPRKDGGRVSRSVAPAVADTAPHMPHGSQASHIARSPTRNSDPWAFLDDVKKGTNNDNTTGN